MINRFLIEMEEEYQRAILMNEKFNSAHEGWAVIKEEVDELWDEVRKKRKNRNPDDMHKECIQIAAMAMRFSIDLLSEKEPR